MTDEAGALLAAKEVTITASKAQAGVEPIRRTAQPTGTGEWRSADLLLVPKGEWSIRVEALVSDFEKPIFEGTIKLQ